MEEFSLTLKKQYGKRKNPQTHGRNYLITTKKLSIWNFLVAIFEGMGAGYEG